MMMKFKKENKQPLPGETWIMEGEEKGPWEPSKRIDTITKVLDVKDGWVRYESHYEGFNDAGERQTGTLWLDDRLELDTFLYCYKFLK